MTLSARAPFTPEVAKGAVPIVLAACLAASPASAVIGPSADGAALSPVVVMVLQRSGAAAGFCSGIVVGRRTVLTAAHCVPAGADLRVHYRDEAGKPVLLPVADVVRNPGYRADAVRARQRSIDLAVVRLPADLPARFRSATLGTMAATRLGARFRIAGYGVTREGDGRSSGQLRVGEIAARGPLSSLLLWAKGAEGQGGACTGDSGGPVLDAEADTVEAMTLWSAGSGKAKCGDLTQAIWLGPYRSWLDGLTKP
ncbi:MAG TPA: trypsin-like serine protease [Lichenihabitans sp.]|jgi:hypothetical protein|nr:trypsin-like serine protease [Lichenihabitans sp.]